MAALIRSASGSLLYQRSSSMNKSESSETTPFAEEILVRQSSQERMARSDSQFGAASSGQAIPAMWYRNAVLAFVGTLVVVGVVCAPSFGSSSGMQGEPMPAPATEADKWAHASRALPFHLFVKSTLGGNKKFLVVDQGPDVKYHRGTILTGDRKATLKVHVVFYGEFSRTQKAIVHSFLSSFTTPKASPKFPTVAGWWAIMKGYRNTKKWPVAPNVVLGTVVHDWKYSLTKSLKQTDIEKLIVSNLKKGLALDPNGLYLVLTAKDVSVQGFCSSQCGTHSSVTGSAATNKFKLPYAWVGNAEKFCGGYCAWPFFKPLPGSGPDVPPLKAPNGDGGVDGMIINIASMIAGATTNPFGNGYYQGDALDPLEAAGVCGGIYGPYSYPGYPGELLKDSKGTSFNMYGARRRKFLVPWIFNPATKKCAGQA